MGVELIRIRKSVRVGVLVAIHNPVLIRIQQHWVGSMVAEFIGV